MRSKIVKNKAEGFLISIIAENFRKLHRMYRKSIEISIIVHDDDTYFENFRFSSHRRKLDITSYPKYIGRSYWYEVIDTNYTSAELCKAMEEIAPLYNIKCVRIDSKTWTFSMRFRLPAEYCF